MEIKLEGYLNPEHNKKLYLLSANDSISSIKSLNIKLLDSDSIVKIKNLVNHYKENNIRFPIFKAVEGGLIIKTNVSNLISIAPDLIINYKRKDWFNKKYKFRIIIKKIQFFVEGNKITKINFNLNEFIMI